MPASRDEPATPCPEPPGGWRVVDPSRTTCESLARTFAAAHRLEGYAGSWMDQSITPASRGSAEEDDDLLMNDVTRLIINVTVTGDTTAAEARLREIWGGALCVSRARHTAAELLRALDEVLGTPGMLTAGQGKAATASSSRSSTTTALQRELDGRFGAGFVVVPSALRPAEGWPDAG